MLLFASITTLTIRDLGPDWPNIPIALADLSGEAHALGGMFGGVGGGRSEARTRERRLSIWDFRAA